MTQRTRDIAILIISTIVVLTFCVYTLYFIVKGQDLNYPPAFAAIVTLVIGFYFGSHANADGATTATQAAVATLMTAQRATGSAEQTVDTARDTIQKGNP